MSIKEVEFTIREVTYYAGRMTIDTDEWERIFGEPFDKDALGYGYDLSEYEHLNTLGHEHEEHKDVGGQYWFDVGISDALRTEV